MAKMEDAQSTANSDRKMLFTVVQHNCFDMPNINALKHALQRRKIRKVTQTRRKGKGEGEGEGEREGDNKH